MNYTSLATTEYDKNVPQDAGAPRPKSGWLLSDRWAWAYGLPVSGIARAVAGCIAYHANDKTGLSWPGMALIVKETGFKRTAVIAAIKALERGGHVTVRRFQVGKKNASNRYQLPPMGNVSVSHPSPPDAPPPSAPDGPELVRTEQVRTKRKRCAVCGNSWPSRFGDACFVCLKKQTGPKPRGGRPTYHDRPVRPDRAPMTAERAAELETERTARIEDRLAADPSWGRIGGKWKKAWLQARGGHRR